MFTVCSKCNLRLTVTATDLRAAQGYVRCGRCHNVFNALAALSEETPESTGIHRVNTAKPAAPPGAHLDVQDEMVAPAENNRADATKGLEFDPAATSVESIFVSAAPATHHSGTFESIILRGGEADEAVADDVQVMHMPAADLAALRQAAAEGGMAEEPSTASAVAAGTAGRASGAEVPADQERAGEAQAGDDPLMAGPHAAAPQSRRTVWLLSAACALLAALLMLQAVNHWRGDLAATAPLHGPLTALYAGLGLPLSPRWDVSRYEVRQLGALAGGQEKRDSAGSLEVHASIKNTAPRAQPLPLLRVTIEDRYGNRVAARDLEPREYLRQPPADGMLPPGARVDAQARFVDPGQAATGFELDACLRLASGRVTCANDPGFH